MTKAQRLPNKDDLLAIWQASGLKEKLLFTFAMLIVFRMAAQIPIWGVQPEIFAQQMAQLAGLIDMFSGGALAQLSIASLGIGPYITASIIMQLMTVVIPHLETLQKEEGEQGRRKISQYTRYLTLILALIQSSIVVKVVLASGALLPNVSPTLFAIMSVISITAGAIFALWLAELITARGIGNGGSLLIFIGIISRMPKFVSDLTNFATSGTSSQSFLALLLVLVFIGTIAFIVILQEATRKVFIVSAKRQVGNKIYGGQSTHIPFKLNPGSVMPIIFAFAVLMFPATLFNMLSQQSNVDFGMLTPAIDFLVANFTGGQWLFVAVEVALIFFFTFFYASIMPNMQPKDIADNLKKYGSSIPGIKPGRPTADFIQKILTRIIFIGASFLAIVALIPNLVEVGLGKASGAVLLGGFGTTSLIIMVGVALDFVNQIKVNLLARQYEGFLR